MTRLSAALNAQRTGRADTDFGAPPRTAGMDRKIRTPTVTPAKIAYFSGTLMLIAVLAYGYSKYGLIATQAVTRDHITVTQVVNGTFHDYIPITGSVAPRNTVYLDAIEGGQVTEVFVEEGEHVEKGQPLLTLKNTSLQLEVVGREAQLTEQINNLGLAQLSFQQNRLRHRQELLETNHQIVQLGRKLDGYNQLIKTGAISREVLEQTQEDYDFQIEKRDAIMEAQKVNEQFQTAQIEALETGIRNMNSNIVLARESLQNLAISSPIDGQLTVLDAQIGQSKAPGERMGQIDEIDSFKVRALVDEFYLSRVHFGLLATTVIDGNEHRLEVVKIYPEVRNRQFEIELSFTDSKPSIRRGQTLRLRLQIGAASESMVVANGAFYDDTGGTWVFVLEDGGGAARRRDVHLGRRNPDQIEVIGGLNLGDRIISSSYRQFIEAEQLLIRD